MLNELLEELKEAIEINDVKTQKRIVNMLNKLGMDNFTIKTLLKEI